MVLSEAATLARIEPFWSWNTPIAWTGFILFADAIVARARGSSWLHSAPREFAFLALVSIPLWLVFEFFNLFIENWYYTGLPENFALRMFGYAWAFATIWPAIFLGAELVAIGRGRRSQTVPGSRPGPEGPGLPVPPGPPALPAPPAPPTPPAPPALVMMAGGLMLVWPILWPSPYLAAPVWLGFIFLLDPINARLGGESLTRDLAAKQYDRLINLCLSGLLCGVLWEFWNYWARAKWHYTVPIMENLKIFEMPVPGYLGFPAFALECFTMYVFVRAMLARLWTAATAPAPRLALRPIGL
jgi:hypothetical protein